MSDPGATGNPVFDYRAGFRAFADKLQRVMLLGGAAIFLVAGVVALVRTELREVPLLVCGGGAVLFVCGVLWGFYWRRKIRAEFREKFGKL